jgi:hypothetical protein
MQWVPGALSPEVKRPEREPDHSPPSNALVKNAQRYTSTLPYVSVAWCLVKKAQGHLYLYFTLLYFTLLYFTLLYFTLLYFTLLYPCFYREPNVGGL